MLFLLKALLGVSAIGGGVIAPIALSQQTVTGLEQKEKEVAKELGSTFGKTVSKFGESFLNVRAREASHAKISKILSEINGKKCELLQNPENKEHWLNALYACNKNDKGVAEFYYVSSRDIFISRAEVGSMKKVSTVNYVEEGTGDTKTAKLELTLVDGSKKDWTVVVGSGWKHFKDVNLGNQCTVSTKEVGGSDLRCVLRGWDNDPNKSSIYRFSIF